MSMLRRVIRISMLIILIGCATYPAGEKRPSDKSNIPWPATGLNYPQPHLVFGEPRYAHHDPKHNITRVYSSFTVYYDDTVLASRWTAIKLTPSMIDANSGYKRPARFSTDTVLKIKGYQYTVHDDYTNVSGDSKTWDRGHMVQFDDARGYGAAAGNESMLTTNICPQVADLNRKGWLALERRMSEFARDYDCVWEFIGPIYKKNPKPFAEGRKVPAPKAFYRIAIRKDENGDVQAVAFIMPQKAVPSNVDLEKYITTIDDIEDMTDLDFLPDLPLEIQDKIESKKGEIWPFVRH